MHPPSTAPFAAASPLTRGGNPRLNSNLVRSSPNRHWKSRTCWLPAVLIQRVLVAIQYVFRQLDRHGRRLELHAADTPDWIEDVLCQLPGTMMGTCEWLLLVADLAYQSDVVTKDHINPEAGA